MTLLDFAIPLVLAFLGLALIARSLVIPQLGMAKRKAQRDSIQRLRR